MIKKSFIISLLGFCLISLSANAGDAEKGKKFLRNVQHVTTLLAVQSTRLVQIFGILLGLKLVFRTDINILIG